MMVLQKHDLEPEHEEFNRDNSATELSSNQRNTLFLKRNSISQFYEARWWRLQLTDKYGETNTNPYVDTAT